MPNWDDNRPLVATSVDHHRYNDAPVKTLLNSCNIIALQEHWLFNFEKNYFDSLISSLHSCGDMKSVDDTMPISSHQRPRGYGGVAFIWNKSINHIVTMHPDGSSHIIVLTVKLPKEKDLCIVNVYMPCRGSSTREDQFMESLDELHEIHNKFHPDHHMILCGDFNASLLSTRCTRDKKFQDFIKNLDLALIEGYPAVPSHYHHNGVDTSTIDYIITTSEILHGITQISVLDFHENTSPHHPVMMQTHLTLARSRTSNQDERRVKKPMWDKGDTTGYRHLVSQYLLSAVSLEDIDGTIGGIVNGLFQAGAASIPCRVPSKKRKQPWSPEIASCLHTHKDALYNWIVDGRPPLPHPSAVLRKDSKKVLRSHFRQETAARCTQLYDRITAASNNDCKVFHDLIKRQRANPSRMPGTTLCAGDKLISENADVLAEWSKHFEALAVPLDAAHFEDEYLADTLCDLEMIESYCRNLPSVCEPVSTKEVLDAIRKLNSGKAADEMGMSAEHLKYSSSIIAPVLATVFTSMIRTRHIPSIMKSGFTIPIHKKGKDQYLTDSYRGITITSIIGKLF